ncbi:hypothetical protein Syun_016228 [Stephania yunnanensis]|uniref:RanBD1 domain-containing protein n=1 Tax=Stephania yunnanensis TaxID=152371 RepID=A0AAP0J4I1_9MAGN
MASTDHEDRRDEEETTVAAEDEDTGAHIAPIVKLEEVAVTTGEEHEDAILDMKAKLYRFDKDGNQWKERGVGAVKLLKHKETGKVRLVMRQSKTLKICANHLVLPTMSVQEHAGNDKSCVWHAADYADGELKDELFCIRFASVQNVTEAIQKVAAAYDCKIVEGVLSHQLKQFVIDGNKVVLSVSNPETRVDDAEFEENEVYAIDIVTSTGDGKPKLLDEKQTTVYKRAVDRNYHLKMKASRFIFSEISQKFPIMPFTARALEEKRARLGLVECVNHGLLQPYPVLHEKAGDLVAHIKFTVLLMPNGSDRITSHGLQELQPTKTIEDPEIKSWLALGIKSKKKGGGKKKKGMLSAIVEL